MSVDFNNLTHSEFFYQDPSESFNIDNFTETENESTN
jgi:hypothetical protein